MFGLYGDTVFDGGRFMTNKEIRALAMQKRNAKGLMWVIFAEVAFSACIFSAVYYNLKKGIFPDFALICILYPIVTLVSGAGLARVAIMAWNEGEVHLKELFAYFLNWRLFGRAIAVILINMPIVVVRQIQSSLKESAAGGWGLYIALALVSLCLSVVSVVTDNLYNVIAVMPDADLRMAIPRGLKLGFQNFWRLFGMSLAVIWRPMLLFLCGGFIILIGALFFGGLDAIVPLLFAFIALIALLLALTLHYGPYVVLSGAGLAVELFQTNGSEEK